MADRKHQIGTVAVLSSAICFYLATVIIKLGCKSYHIDPSVFVLTRYILGFALGIYLIRQAQGGSAELRERKFLILRFATNVLAVFTFFKAITLTDVAQANIVNLSYPIFTALFSLFLIPKQRDWISCSLSVVVFIGIYMVVNPTDTGFEAGSFWALASAVLAGLSITALNVTRQKNSTAVILYYGFGFGSLLCLLFFWPILSMDFAAWPYVLACSVLSVLGQFLITFGFRYITAVEGAIFSSSRIIFAALLGPFLVNDSWLTVTGWLGAAIIFCSNIYLAKRASKPKSASTRVD